MNPYEEVYSILIDIAKNPEEIRLDLAAIELIGIARKPLGARWRQ
jgi:hypothetical protein